MLSTKHYTGEFDVNVELHSIEIYPVDGNFRFSTLEQVMVSGEPYGIGNMNRYDATFAELPATIPVVINGSTVQVAKATIMEALLSTARIIIAARETPPPA